MRISLGLFEEGGINGKTEAKIRSVFCVFLILFFLCFIPFGHIYEKWERGCRIKNGEKMKSGIPKGVARFAFALYYTLNRNSTMSPSFITYSFPSDRTRPFSLAAAMEPQAIRSS